MKKHLIAITLVLCLLITLITVTASAIPVYTETEEAAVAGMIGAFLKDSNADLSSYLAALRKEDTALADTYEGIMSYWKDARTTLKVNRYDPETQSFKDEQGRQVKDADLNCYTSVVGTGINEIPDELGSDNTDLCILCLGYALQDDGNMKNELYGRLLTAYAVWKQYPGSCIAVTGGATAQNAPSVTEGSQMKSFLVKELGVPEKNVICEDKAANTADNATNTMNILSTACPQIDQLFIVTSDYHVARACTFFNTAAQLCSYETGKSFAIVGNCGFATNQTSENESLQYASLYEQMYFVCHVADSAADGKKPDAGNLTFLDRIMSFLFEIRNRIRSIFSVWKH